QLEDKPVPMDKAPFHIPVFQNDWIILLNVNIPPGRNTGYHIHYADSVSVNLMPASQTNQNYGSNEVSAPGTGGEGAPGRATFTNVTKDGPRTHRATNVGPTPFHNISFIFKKPGPAGNTVSDRSGVNGYTQIMDNARLRAWRVILEPGQSTGQITQTAPGLRVYVHGGVLALAADVAPKFEIDTSWPKPLPNNWIFGQIGGIFVDKDDNVWISQRPRTVNDRDKRAERGDKAICCYTAPSVVEFNQTGEVVKAWGGPKTAQGYDWPQNEHGMFVDYKGNVWIGGNGENDGMVLKFTNDGKFLMAIGKSAAQTNSLDKTRVGRAADMVVDPATNELYVADGYFNHRVAVFDADSGAFKRTWGAYGKPPTDEKITCDAKLLPQQFNNPVHGLRITNDGLVVVSDRGNNRIQMFCTMSPAT